MQYYFISDPLKVAGWDWCRRIWRYDLRRDCRSFPRRIWSQSQR